MSEQLLDWLRGTALSDYMRDTWWAFSVGESIHFIGLCLLFGALLLIDLRILGFYRQISINAVMKLIPLAILGFGINLVSGICLLAQDPHNYWGNPVFKLKMALIVLGGINAGYHEVACKARMCALPQGADADRTAKLVAGISLTAWTLVIIAGRLLPQFALEG